MHTYGVGTCSMGLVVKMDAIDQCFVRDGALTATPWGVLHLPAACTLLLIISEKKTCDKVVLALYIIVLGRITMSWLVCDCAQYSNNRLHVNIHLRSILVLNWCLNQCHHQGQPLVCNFQIVVYIQSISYPHTRTCSLKVI